MRRKLTGILAVILSASMLVTPAMAATVSEDLSSAESVTDSAMDLPEEGTIADSNTEENTLQNDSGEESDEVSAETDPAAVETDDTAIQTEEQEASALEASSVYTIAYDDVLDFQSDYPGYSIASVRQVTSPVSYQVSEGKCTRKTDENVLLKETDYSVHATGVGIAMVTLTNSLGARKQVGVTVKPATLTLMLIAGQSNAEGGCSINTGYKYSQSIACPDHQVYSSYCPANVVYQHYIVCDAVTGLNFQNYCNENNADDFVPGSLTEDVSISGKTIQYTLDRLTASGNGKTGIDSGLAYEWNCLTGDKVWVVNAAQGDSTISQWVPGAECYDRAEAIFDDAYQTYKAELEAGHYVAGEQLMFWLQGESDRSTSISAYQTNFDLMYNGIIDSYASFGEDTDLDAIGAIAVRSSKGSYTNSEDLYMSSARAVQYAAAASGEYPKFYVVSNANEQWISNQGVSGYFTSKYGTVIGDEDGEYMMQCGTGTTPTTVAQVHNEIHYSQIGHNENGITAAEGMYHALQGDSSIETVRWRTLSGLSISCESFTMLYDNDYFLVPVTEPVYASKQASYYVDYSGTAGNYKSVSDNVWYKGDQGQSVFQYYIDRNNLNAGDLKVRTKSSFFNDDSVTVSVKEGNRLVSDLQLNVLESYDSIVDLVGKYTGFYELSGSWYYYVDGILQKNLTSIIQDTEGTIDDTMSWWYVENGKVTIATTIAKKDDGWWYVNNGKLDTSFTGVAKRADNSTWWGVFDGKVDFTYTGFLSNTYGWWYVSNGKVSLQQTGVYKGTVQGTTAWWYVQDSKVTYTNTVAKNSNGWWVIRNGQVDFGYNGFASNSNGIWYCVNGKVNFGTNSVIKATVDGITAWWYVSGGKITLTDTVAKNSNGWWYIKNGMVDFSFTGLGKNNNGWWYCKNGKVDFTYTGLAENSAGLWYCANGKLDFTYTGFVKYNNVWRYVKDGKADLTYNGYVLIDGKYYRVKNGVAQV